MKADSGYGSGSAPNTNDNHIISKWGIGGINNASYSLGIKQDGKPFSQTFNGSGSGISYDTIVPISLWQHLLVTLKGGTMKLYLNNTLLDSATNVVTPQASNYNLSIGREEYGGYAYWKGAIDDIRIYERALSKEEVKSVYEEGSGVTGLNPLTYNNTIKIYPNPTKDMVTVDNGNFSSIRGYQIKIMNALGQVMHSEIISGSSSQVSLNSIGAKGTYFIQLYDAQSNLIEVKKLILQ